LLLEQVRVTCEVAGLSADGGRWRTRHTIYRADGAGAAVVSSLSAWIDVHARKITAPPAELLAAFVAARSEDCELIGS
jgi:acyl-CoA thioester hydrolase